jgi:predicted phage tail component-like protein
MTATVLDFSIDSVNASTKYFTSSRFIKPLIPQIDQKTIIIPKRDGAIPDSQNVKAWPLIIKGFLEGTDPDNLITRLEDLSAFLYSDIARTLILSNQADRYYNAQYLDYFEVLRDGDISFLDLIFTCNDPFPYDITADTDDNTITVLDDTFIITNSGHYYAFPVITITFNATQSHIYIENNGISGNRFDITRPFVATDELEVDCKNGTVKLNGVADYTGFGSGGDNLAEWIKLAVGNNEIAVGSDDETIDVDINFSWNKPYLY